MQEKYRTKWQFEFAEKEFDKFRISSIKEQDKIPNDFENSLLKNKKVDLNKSKFNK